MIIVWTYGAIQQEGGQHNGTVWTWSAKAEAAGANVFEIFSSPVIEVA